MNQITRSLLGAAVFAAVAGAALSVAVLEKKGKQSREEQKEKDKKVFPDLNADDVVEVELTYQGTTLRAQKTESTWTLSAPLNSEGDDATFAALTSGLSALTFKSRLDAKEVDPATVELQEPTHRVKAKTKAGLSMELWVGKKSGFNESFYIRAGTEAATGTLGMTEAYQLHAFQKSVLDFREKRLVKLLSSDVESLEVKVGKPSAESVSFSAKRHSKGAQPEWDDPWDLVEPLASPADAEEINRAIQALTGTRALAFADPAQTPQMLGLDAPVLVVTLAGKGASTVLKLAQDKREPTVRWWAQRAGSPDVAEVTEDAAQALMKAAFTWRDKRVTRFERDAAHTLEWALLDGTRVVVQKTSGADASEEEWKVTAPKTGRAVGWKISSTLYALGNLKAAAFEKEGLVLPLTDAQKKEWGLGSGARDAVVKDAAGKVLAHVWVGREPGDRRLVWAEGSTALMAVEKAKVDELPGKLDEVLESTTDAPPAP